MAWRERSKGINGGMVRPRLVSSILTALLVGAGVVLAPALPSSALVSPSPMLVVANRTIGTWLVSTNPAGTTPQILDGSVEALAQVGNRIIAAGVFTSVRSANTSVVLARRNLFAYDPTNGRVDPGFAPAVNGEVLALQASSDGASVYVGGVFTSVNGQPTAYAVRLSVATGASVTAFAPNLNGRVSDFDLRGTTLYATGWFTKSRGQAHVGVAALDATTGKPDPWLTLALSTTRVPDGVRRVNVAPDKTRMVLAGNFTSISGVARDQIAVIDLTTVPVTVRADWRTTSLAYNCPTCTRPDMHTYVRDVALSADGSYVIVVNSFYYPGNGDSAIRYDLHRAGTDIPPTWIRYTGKDTVTAVTISAGGVVYIGGHFRWWNVSQVGSVNGRVTRWGLAALDAQTGMAYEWVPTRDRGYGVLAMMIDRDGDLIIGDDTDMVGGEWHSRLAMFPAAQGHQIVSSAPVALPVQVSRVGVSSQTTVSFNGRTVGATRTTASPIAGFLAGTVINGSLVIATTTGFFRLEPGYDGQWAMLERLNIADLSSATVTGMAFQNETLYLTLSGNPLLYAVNLNSDSFLSGRTLTAVGGPSTGAGRDYVDVTGMFAAGGYLWVGSTNGQLDRTRLANGSLPATASAPLVVSGPRLDGQDWSTPMYLGAPPAPTVPPRNLVIGNVATESTSGIGAAGAAIDGNREGYPSIVPIAGTGSGDQQWWQVDLGAVTAIDKIRIFPRTDALGEWLASPWVFVSDTPFITATQTTTAASPGVMTVRLNGIPAPGTTLHIGRTGRYVRVQTGALELCGVQLAEVEVLAAPGTGR